MKPLAVALILLGVVGLAWGGLTWTQSEKVIDLGPIEVQQEKTKSIPIPPVLGIAALAAGSILLLRR